MASGDHRLVDLGPRACAIGALGLALVALGCGGGRSGDEVDFVQLPGSRLIKVQSVGLAAFGPIVPHTATAAEATAAFGEPDAVARRGGTCTRRWSGLGLTIEFATASGEDPCEDGARIEQARVGGPAAAKEGWRTAEGIRPRMSVEAARRLYPDAHRRRDGALILVEVLEGRRADGADTVLEVTTGGGRVDDLVFPIGAASG